MMTRPKHATSGHAKLERAGHPVPARSALPATRRTFAPTRPAPRAPAGHTIVKTRVLALAALLASGTTALAAEPVEVDPLRTDPDKYRLLLENERVRVLEYRDLPGDVTHEHHHPDYVVYALGPAGRELRLPDGTTLEMELRTGDVFFSPAQTHIGRNTGSVPSHAILVELKEGAGTPSSAVAPTASRTAGDR